MNILNLIGRDHLLFENDINNRESILTEEVKKSRFLVLGGAGSIGQAVVKEIFKRDPQKLHVVDISENNLVELVRDIRSSYGYIDGDFQTFALDIGSLEYDTFINSDGKYDYVLNLSALKHVRSEKDPFTLMRMIDVNIFNTYKSIQQSVQKGVKKYFCVSTDKAANPVNMMGASKRIMEMFIMKSSQQMNISTARFANVAFSDGSLLHGFNKRIEKLQPIVAPTDVTRYFVVPQEAGELCLMSCLLGENRDIFFPNLDHGLDLISFADIAENYLRQKGYEPHMCSTEQEARDLMNTLPQKGKWPCYFTVSDTTGEKSFEEFYTNNETIDLDRFENLGVIKNEYIQNDDKISYFEEKINEMKSNREWKKSEIVDLFKQILPNFSHEEKGKFLDSKM
ncbi:UDP-N-acetylglucosamine 4,6-dehydratase [Nonlabens tegetincola]|uniref:UDP-N-acetylglucosamine 4,6-dehydratase n=1 Tax=Nonlabens tegetincola TaxID=323273 RepID=A0A090Q5L6_9FLAO|nr:UDP-N-acetylglucosamine 4,6-dehydratase [Nonlabens tegetincola]GAK97013.1 UDP-N-acetylglucosamine 4,6-dehydratase [Nonlabens tegetincola]